jgi:hypothetical protein
MMSPTVTTAMNRWARFIPSLRDAKRKPLHSNFKGNASYPTIHRTLHAPLFNPR